MTAKVGVEADLKLGDVYVPVSAGAGVTLGSELDKDRPLEKSLVDLVSPGDDLVATKRYVVGLRYSAQLNASIRDILSGHVDGKLKLKLFFFSKTWRKTLLNFNGFCHGRSEYTACGLRSASAVARWRRRRGQRLDSLGRTSPGHAVPRLARITTTATPGNVTEDTTVVGKFFYDSLCTCIDGDSTTGRPRNRSRLEMRDEKNRASKPAAPKKLAHDFYSLGPGERQNPMLILIRGAVSHIKEGGACAVRHPEARIESRRHCWAAFSSRSHKP